jgi:hypothetical protein
LEGLKENMAAESLLKDKLILVVDDEPDILDSVPEAS